MPADSTTPSRDADPAAQARRRDPWFTRKPRERLALHGVEGEVLARSRRGDGRHVVLRVVVSNRDAVLKLYGRKRGWLKDTLRDVGHRWLLGKTGMSPEARWRTETETLELWRRHGFDVPASLDAALPPAMPPLRLLSEWLPGRPLYLPIEDPFLAVAEKERLLERLAAEWERRHALAIELREPRLIQSHAMLAHVFHVAAGAAGPGSAERLVTLDFEVAWARSSAVPRLASLEIAQLLDSIARWAPLEQVGPLIAAFVRGYPARERLVRVLDDARRGRLPLFSWLQRLALALRERGPRRKRAVLGHLERALAGCGAVLAAWLALAPAAAAQDGHAPAGEGPEVERMAPIRISGALGSAMGGGGDWTLHLGGRLALDLVRYDRRNEHENGFEFGALRPAIELDLHGRARAYAELDLDAVDSKGRSRDLWIEWRPAPPMTVQAGKLRVALGSEFATREENLPLIGHGFTSYLTGRHDWGARVGVDAAGGALHLEGVATIGAGFGLEGESKDDPLLMARATLEPLRSVGPDFLRGLYLGFATSLQPGFHDEIRLTTPLESVVFVTPELRGDHARFMLLEGGWRCGPLRIGAEHACGWISDVNLPSGREKDIDELNAWTAYASLFLGEARPRWSRGRWLKPGRDARRDDEGGTRILIDGLDVPVELSFRYSNADLDRALFDEGIAAYDPSTQEVRTAAATISLHVGRGQRVMLGVVRTLADHELAIFDGANRDTSFIARWEIVF